MRVGLVFAFFSGISLVACGGHDAAGDAAPARQSEDELATTNELTDAQQTLVLDMIDDHCGDSWCEGDFDWRFTKMSCSFAAKRSCTMTTQAIDGSDPKKTYWRSCKMTGITSFTAMVETFPNGFQDLTSEFYDKVDTCITAIEDKLR